MWVPGIRQSVSGGGGNSGVDTTGVEGGVKLGAGGAEVVLSAFKGKGLGISTIGALFLGTSNAAGDELESKGAFAQLTYKFTDDLKLGMSYGQNRDEDLVTVGSTTKRKAAAFGAYDSLTPSITLVGEYIRERTDNLVGSPLGTEVKAQSISLGGILFF